MLPKIFLTKTTITSGLVWKAATLYENTREEDGLWRGVDVELYAVYHEIPDTRAAAEADEDDGSETEEDAQLYVRMFYFT